MHHSNLYCCVAKYKPVKVLIPFYYSQCGVWDRNMFTQNILIYKKQTKPPSQRNKTLLHYAISWLLPTKHEKRKRVFCHTMCTLNKIKSYHICFNAYPKVLTWTIKKTISRQENVELVLYIVCIYCRML